MTSGIKGKYIHCNEWHCGKRIRQIQNSYMGGSPKSELVAFCTTCLTACSWERHRCKPCNCKWRIQHVSANSVNWLFLVSPRLKELHLAGIVWHRHFSAKLFECRKTNAVRHSKSDFGTRNRNLWAENPHRTCWIQVVWQEWKRTTTVVSEKIRKSKTRVVISLNA